jgi:hypothetical protein
MPTEMNHAAKREFAGVVLLCDCRRGRGEGDLHSPECTGAQALVRLLDRCRTVTDDQAGGTQQEATATPALVTKQELAVALLKCAATAEATLALLEALLVERQVVKSAPAALPGTPFVHARAVLEWTNSLYKAQISVERKIAEFCGAAEAGCNNT